MINVGAKFVLAGEATFTVSNPSGEHRTYHIYKAKPSPQFPGPSYFAKLLTGPDNADIDSYQYVGRLVWPGDHFEVPPYLRMTARSKFAVDSVNVKVLQWALRAIWQAQNNGYRLPAGYSIRHLGRCGRCGLPLTTPESLSTGLGPVCAAELGVEWRDRERELVSQRPLEGM